MKRLIVLIVAVVVAGTTSVLAQEATPAATQPSEVSVQVQSVRMIRNNGLEGFGNRYFNDGNNNPGVTLRLLLQLEHLTIVSLGQDAVSIDTFVDDTYQSLIGSDRESGYYNPAPQPPQVSDDGHRILFSVQSTRQAAMEATRVFARGAVRASVARGDLKIQTAKLALKVGQQSQVGPFKVTLRSLSDNGPGGLSVQISIEGNVSSIRKIRVLGADGLPLQSNVAPQRASMAGSGDATAMANLNFPSGRDDVTLEFAYAEKTELVKIPFEAQVDVGITKAGPIESIQASAPRAGVINPNRPWPPPPPGVITQEQWFSRRSAILATSQPSDEGFKLNKVGVDMFSLTVAKPAPGEAPGVRWENPPSKAFFATGFTIARLMVSTPDIFILSAPPSGVSITRFEDDKGGKLSTDVYRQDDRMAAVYPAGFGGPASISPDGQQSLITVSLASPPTPGATRCTLGGTVRATVGQGKKIDLSDPIPAKSDQSFICGSFRGRIATLRQNPPLTPFPTPNPAEAWIVVNGPVDNIYSIELIDPATKEAITVRPWYRGAMQNAPETLQVGMQLRQTNVESVAVRITHFKNTKQLEIPFEVSTPLGL